MLGDCAMLLKEGHYSDFCMSIIPNILLYYRKLTLGLPIPDIGPLSGARRYSFLTGLVLMSAVSLCCHHVLWLDYVT